MHFEEELQPTHLVLVGSKVGADKAERGLPEHKTYSCCPLISGKEKEGGGSLFNGPEGLEVRGEAILQSCRAVAADACTSRVFGKSYTPLVPVNELTTRSNSILERWGRAAFLTNNMTPM